MKRSTVLEGASLMVAGAGLLGLYALGGWLEWATIVGFALLILAPFGRRVLPGNLPWAAITGLGAVAAPIAVLALGGAVFDAMAAACLCLLVLRRWSRTGPTDDRVTAVVAMLMLVLAAALDPNPWVGLGSLVWIAAAPLVGVLTYLEGAGSRTARERRVVGGRLAWISVFVMLTALATFVVMPRLRSGHLGQGASAADASVGFSDHVELGEIDELLDDPTPVLRFELPPSAPVPEYLRGLVLDRFDGGGWSATIANAESPAGPPPGATAVRITQEAGAGPVAFAPGYIAAIDGPFQPDQAGSWRLEGPPRRVAYTAYLIEPPVDRSDPARWTTLPDLDPRIAELAATIAGDERDPQRLAARVSAWLDTNAEYTRRPRNAQAEGPLATFLFETRAGHCEYFATAAAVLLRAQGQPARVVNGYARPEVDPTTGRYLVRQGHAHAWVEVRDAAGRWHLVDPTPGGSRPPLVSGWQRVSDVIAEQWTTRVLAYDGSTQLDTLQRAGWWVQTRVTGSDPSSAVPWFGLLVLVIGAAGLGGLAMGALSRLGARLAGEKPARPPGPVARVHARARRLVARNGWDIPSELPPVEAAAWLASQVPDAGAALKDLAWLHYRVRYGDEPDLEHVAEARGLLVRLRASLVRAPHDPVSSSA